MTNLSFLDYVLDGIYFSGFSFRRLTNSDLIPMSLCLKNSLFNNYLTDSVSFSDEKSAYSFGKKLLSDSNSNLAPAFSIVSAFDGVWCGYFKFSKSNFNSEEFLEFSIRIAPFKWKSGLALRAATCVLSLLSQDFPSCKVLIRCLPKNKPINSFCKKSGFELISTYLDSKDNELINAYSLSLPLVNFKKPNPLLDIRLEDDFCEAFYAAYKKEKAA